MSPVSSRSLGLSTMRRFGFILWLLNLSQSALCQNLVPNPSFECGGPVCNWTTDASTFGVNECYWNCPTGGTSDIFDTQAAGNCYAFMPNRDSTSMGSQLPRTGHRFAGIFNMSVNESNPYREYLQVQLTEPLVIGEYYQASMYVSLAEGEDYASNNLGMYFSENKIQDFTNFGILSFAPQVNSTEVIKDSDNWVKVCGKFRATTAARYLLIGNFFPDALTDVFFKGGTKFHPPWNNYAYYFIDDVSVVNVSPKSTFSVTGKSPICQNQSSELKAADILFDNYAWATYADSTVILSTSSSVTVAPLVTTKYIGKADGCHLTYRDTITIVVHPTPQINLGKDTTICTGTELKLDAGAGNTEYLWKDKSTNEYFTVNSPGYFSVRVKNKYGCQDSSKISVRMVKPPIPNFDRDFLVCKGFYPISAEPGMRSYLWSTGSTDSVLLPTKAGKYWVTVENQCGQSLDSVRVFSLADIFYPNVVTQNNDGRNETFKVIGIGENIHGSIRIYNRWGATIFKEDVYRNDWPTTDDLPAGVYFFDLNYHGCPQNHKGWIQVLK